MQGSPTKSAQEVLVLKTKNSFQVPRIPPVDRNSEDSTLASLFEAIQSRGGGPFNIHLTIGHSPEILAAFLNFARVLRAEATCPRVDRELIILRSAQLANCQYVFNHHRGMGLAFGLTAEQVDQLAHWKEGRLFNTRQRAILAYSEAMFGSEKIDNATFGKLSSFYKSREIMELTLTAAFYAGLGQFACALEIQVELDASDSHYEQS